MGFFRWIDKLYYWFIFGPEFDISPCGSMIVEYKVKSGYYEIDMPVSVTIKNRAVFETLNFNFESTKAIFNSKRIWWHRISYKLSFDPAKSMNKQSPVIITPGNENKLNFVLSGRSNTKPFFGQKKAVCRFESAGAVSLDHYSKKLKAKKKKLEIDWGENKEDATS